MIYSNAILTTELLKKLQSYFIYYLNVFVQLCLLIWSIFKVKNQSDSELTWNGNRNMLLFFQSLNEHEQIKPETFGCGAGVLVHFYYVFKKDLCATSAQRKTEASSAMQLFFWIPHKILYCAHIDPKIAFSVSILSPRLLTLQEFSRFFFSGYNPRIYFNSSVPFFLFACPRDTRIKKWSHNAHVFCLLSKFFSARIFLWCAREKFYIWERKETAGSPLKKCLHFFRIVYHSATPFSNTSFYKDREKKSESICNYNWSKNI